jgi:hypothetical protein
VREQRSFGPRRVLIVALGLLALAGVVLGVLALTDTGPFGDDEPEQLGEEDFLARGDQICETAHDQYVEAQREPPQTASEAAELTANLIEISEQELSDIRELGAPEQLQESLDRYLEAREEAIDLLRDAQEAAEQSDPKAYEDAQQEVESGQLKRTRLAEEVGFSQCSRPLSAADVASSR